MFIRISFLVFFFPSSPPRGEFRKNSQRFRGKKSRIVGSMRRGEKRLTRRCWEWKIKMSCPGDRVASCGYPLPGIRSKKRARKKKQCLGKLWCCVCIVRAFAQLHGRRKREKERERGRQSRAKGKRNKTTFCEMSLSDIVTLLCENSFLSFFFLSLFFFFVSCLSVYQLI